MARKILLSQEFGSNIFTRNTISAFFEKVNKMKEEEIVLDFNDIEFISRSCADEYLKQKEESNKKIIERNMLDEVCHMFNAVKSQYDKKGITISFLDTNSHCKRKVLA